MIRRVFIDSNVILDVGLGREPFFADSKNVLALAENSIITGYISSNEAANLYYLLRNNGGDKKARFFIRSLIKFLNIVTITHKNVQEAIDSDFSDFEDALQNYSAIENQCDYIVTRNIKDYSISELSVKNPADFILLYKHL